MYNNDSITFICFLLGFFAVEIILVIIHITSITLVLLLRFYIFFIFKQPFIINVVIYSLLQIIEFKLSKLYIKKTIFYIHP
jgi:hypothetical protein